MRSILFILAISVAATNAFAVPTMQQPFAEAAGFVVVDESVNTSRKAPSLRSSCDERQKARHLKRTAKPTKHQREQEEKRTYAQPKKKTFMHTLRKQASHLLKTFLSAVGLVR